MNGTFTVAAHGQLRPCGGLQQRHPPRLYNGWRHLHHDRSGTGTCTVQHHQAGNGTYSAAPQVTNSTTATLASQTIGAVSFTPATLSVGGTTTVPPRPAPVCLSLHLHNTQLLYRPVPRSPAQLAGTCTIAADQAGNTNYTPPPR